MLQLSPWKKGFTGPVHMLSGIIFKTSECISLSHFTQSIFSNDTHQAKPPPSPDIMVILQLRGRTRGRNPFYGTHQLHCEVLTEVFSTFNNTSLITSTDYVSQWCTFSGTLVKLDLIRSLRFLPSFFFFFLVCSDRSLKLTARGEDTITNPC